VTERGHDFSAEVRDLTQGQGVNCVIDTVGTPLFTSARKSLAKAGRWVLVGQLTGEFVPFNPAQLFLRNLAMLSATSTTRQGLADTLSLIARGAVKPVISGEFPLADAALAHRAVEAGSVSGRLVLRPSP
jgi:NADPH:quinone reductase-like Zn-dependent oxidoreductase